MFSRMLDLVFGFMTTCLLIAFISGGVTYLDPDGFGVNLFVGSLQSAFSGGFSACEQLGLCDQHQTFDSTNIFSNVIKKFADLVTAGKKSANEALLKSRMEKNINIFEDKYLLKKKEDAERKRQTPFELDDILFDDVKVKTIFYAMFENYLMLKYEGTNGQFYFVWYTKPAVEVKPDRVPTNIVWEPSEAKARETYSKVKPKEDAEKESIPFDKRVFKETNAPA